MFNSFGEIDNFFTVFNSNQDLANEFKLITSRNGNILAARESTIDTRIEQINEYYKLQTCTAAAGNILKFKDSLGLQGDFQAVKDLQNQVHINLHLIKLNFLPYVENLGISSLHFNS